MKENDPVWYACYGSNLKAKRFKDYIVGNDDPELGSPKEGCIDKTLWKDSKVKEYPGVIYFGNRSNKYWDNKGVAFYDPNQEGKTLMRLYKITYGQLLDVWKQEGNGKDWYNSLYPLEIAEDGIQVYTITSEERKKTNQPSEKYRTVIKEALVDECGMREEDAQEYLRQALNR